MPTLIPDEWIVWVGDPTPATERLLEEELGSEMLPARLASLISAISERNDRAGWGTGIELALWSETTGRTEPTRCTERELEALRHAAKLLDGGWVAWDLSLDGPALFSKDEWRDGEGCPLN